MASNVFVYEFLYRANYAGDDGAWHVILGGTIIDPLTLAEKPWRSDVMSTAQVRNFGFELPRIIAEINAVVLAELEGKRSILDRAEATEEELRNIKQMLAAIPANEDVSPNANAKRGIIKRLMGYLSMLET